MADAKGSEKERPRNPKKVFIGALKGDVTEELMRLAMEPAAKGEAIVSISIVPDKNPDYSGGKIAFVEVKDEATAACVITLLDGVAIPEISDRKVEAALAFAREREDEPAKGPPRPRLTKVEIEAIATALAGNPRFAEKCRGEDGKSPTVTDVAAKLKADAAFVAATKGNPGDPGQKGDPGAPGQKGEDGKSPTVTDVAAKLKADAAFVAATKGNPGDPGPRGKNAPRWPHWVLVVLAIVAIVLAFSSLVCKGQGPAGPKGEIGLQGPQGPAGAQGESAPAPTAAELVTALKADEEFLSTVTPAVPVEMEAAPEVETPPAAPVADGVHRGPRVVADRFDNVERKFHAIDERLDALERARHH